MALTGALNTTLAGIQLTEARINVLSGNVTNADKVGYTRKELETSYVSVNGQTIALRNSIETVNFNPYLLESIIEDASTGAFHSTISEYLNNYTNELGSIDGENSISAFTNDLAASLDRLSLTPEDTSLKNQVIADADRLATALRRISESIQDFRLQTDENIERSVDEINQSVIKIEEINERIREAQVTRQGTANLEDDRNTELEKLSQLINIDYFINNNNEVQIYTGGRPLLDSRARTIEYTANTNLDKTTLYPAGFNPIDLDGFDLTPSLRTGELGGLVTLRDQTFVEEQAKMDEFSAALIRELNTILNTGASIPPRAEIIGDVDGLIGTTPITATGSVRIATTDNNGVVQDFADINLGGIANINDLLIAINTALGPNVTASLTTDGELRMIANNAGEGLMLNQLNSNFAGGESFSLRFGLNGMFSGDGADNIAVSQYLLDDGSALATSQLVGGALAIGDTGVFVGDSSLASAMKNAFTTDTTYAAAGNFAAQTDSLSNYVDKIISDAAYRTNNSLTNRDISVSLMQQTKTTLQNISAVNIDEELANLIDLEAKYEASATMIATIQEMFDTLLNAVR